MKLYGRRVTEAAKLCQRWQISSTGTKPRFSERHSAASNSAKAETFNESMKFQRILILKFNLNKKYKT